MRIHKREEAKMPILTFNLRSLKRRRNPLKIFIYMNFNVEKGLFARKPVAEIRFQFATFPRQRTALKLIIDTRFGVHQNYFNENLKGSSELFL